MSLTVLSPEEESRIIELREKLAKLKAIEEKIVQELRQLIYKIEKL